MNEAPYLEQGPHCTGKTGKWQNIITVREYTGNFDILPIHREVCMLML